MTKRRDPSINKRLLPRSAGVSKKISEANIRYWEKKREAFFNTNPKCSSCKKKIENYTRIMLCDKCRCYKNHQAYKKRNPEHSTLYSRAYKKRKREEKLKEDRLSITKEERQFLGA